MAAAVFAGINIATLRRRPRRFAIADEAKQNVLLTTRGFHFKKAGPHGLVEAFQGHAEGSWGRRMCCARRGHQQSQADGTDRGREPRASRDRRGGETDDDDLNKIDR